MEISVNHSKEAEIEMYEFDVLRVRASYDNPNGSGFCNHLYEIKNRNGKLTIHSVEG